MTTEIAGAKPEYDAFNQPKLPTGLNVLTILTIIGSVFQFVGSIWGFATAKKNLEETPKMIEQMKNQDVPDVARNMIGDPEQLMAIVTKSYENRLPILLLTIIAAVLCLYGAIQMRKLKKQGYTLYMVGELLPFLTSALFLGGLAFQGISFMVMTAITLLFIILYTVNRKHLVY